MVWIGLVIGLDGDVVMMWCGVVMMSCGVVMMW